MPGMSPLVAALIAAIVAFLVTGWWFGVHRRQLAERSAGIAALAGMKWRECVGLVLQALAEKGYREAPASRQPGDGGTEFLLVKGDERCLLSYKHGTAYRLGEANVRDFANAVQLQGANSGILVTLGTAEGFARDLARRYGVELIDGRSLWPQVEPFAPAAMVTAIRSQAAGLIRRGQQIGVLASVGLGVVVFLLGSLLQSAATPAVVEAPAPVATLEPGEFLWHPEVSTSGPVVVIVSLPEQRAHVYRNGLRIGVSTVSTGKPGHDTPTGVFPILQKRVEHYSTLYDDAPMPYMQRLTWDGVALHAGRIPGYPASHGCVRLPREFAELLFDATSHGTTVVVADQSSHSASVVWPGAQAPVDPYTGLEPTQVDVAALATIGSNY